MEKLVTIIPAAGMGSRLKQGKNKAFVKIAGIPLLIQCLRSLNKIPYIKKVIVAVGANEVMEAESMFTAYATELDDLNLSVVAGGKERQDSVANALALVGDDVDYIAIHDGARPLVDEDLFTRTLAAAQISGAAIAAVPVKNTIKFVDGENSVLKTPNRSELRAVQTPQIFAGKLLLDAYAHAKAHNMSVTDDAALIETLGHKVTVVAGNYENIKVTTPEDLIMAENLLRKNKAPVMQFRVGTGFDVHKLVEHRKLILCGVEIPYELGLLGHSDADVATHALMDALLGAAALGDIGKHFPDTDMRYDGADSIKLLEHVVALLHKEGWQINNIDLTIIAQKPKLAPYIPGMKLHLARKMFLDENAVNVKATTTEKLGFTGRGEGIAAEAAVSLIKIS